MLVISGDDDSVLAAAADNKHLLVFEVLPDHPERRPHVLLLPRAQLAVSAETPGKAMTGLSHSVTHGGPTRHHPALFRHAANLRHLQTFGMIICD